MFWRDFVQVKLVKAPLPPPHLQTVPRRLLCCNFLVVRLWFHMWRYSVLSVLHLSFWRLGGYTSWLWHFLLFSLTLFLFTRISSLSNGLPPPLPWLLQRPQKISKPLFNFPIQRCAFITNSFNDTSRGIVLLILTNLCYAKIEANSVVIDFICNFIV